MLLDTNRVLALMWRRAFGHEAAHEWLRGAKRFFTTPSTEWAAIRVSLHKAHGTLPEVLTAISSIAHHKRQKPAADARLPDRDWVIWSHLHGHKLVPDFWLLATAEQLNTKLLTLDARAWEVLPPSQRDRVLVLHT